MTGNIKRDRNPTFDILRVIAMVFVLFAHSTVDEVHREGSFFIQASRQFSSQVLFFLVAGFFVARKLRKPESTLKNYAASRFQSLVIPFLVWNALVLGVVFAARAAGVDAMVEGGAGAYFGVEPSPGPIAAALFGIGRYPIVYQFWFLRDLILISAVAPFFVRWVPQSWVWPVLLLMLPFGPANSFGFFLIGYHAAGMPPVVIPKRSAVVAVAGWLFVLYLQFTGLFEVPWVLRVLCGAMWMLSLAALLSHFRIGRHLALLGPGTFFVYAAHEPLQTVMAKVWEKSGVAGYGSPMGYVLIPLLSGPFLLFVYFGIRRFLPWLLVPLTGGR